jgi:branched-chain amino acid transport system permease protein
MNDYLKIIVLLVIGVAVSFFANTNWLDTLAVALWYAYLCATRNLVGGLAGQFTFAHPVYVAIGGYTSTVLFRQAGISPWLGMLAGAVLSAILAAIISWINFRRRLPRLTYMRATLTLTFIGGMVVASHDYLGSSEGLFIPRANDFWTFRFLSKQPYFLIILVGVSLVLALTAWLRNAPMGLRFIALRDNQDAAAMLGVNTVRTMIVSSTLSAGLAALGGTFYAQYLYVADPSLVHAYLAVVVVLLTAVGGFGTVWGPLIGALVLVPLGRVLNQEFVGIAGLAHVMYVAAIVAVLLGLRDGVMPWAARIRRRRRMALARGAAAPALRRAARP